MQEDDVGGALENQNIGNTLGNNFFYGNGYFILMT